ncbi:MAG: hypothetical protein Q9219_005656 [cf. Caloplaca sp. 3 TL-2023]
MRAFIIPFLLPILGVAAASSAAIAPAEPPLPDAAVAALTTPSAAGATQPNYTYPQLWSLNKKFLDNFIYPASAAQANAINSTLLAEDIQGRIDVTRTFDGRELNTEYLFGLFANLAKAGPGAVTLLGVPQSYEILHFAASGNVVSSLTRFQFNFTALDNLVVPIIIDSWATYNARGQISQYDATFKYWQWTVDYLFQAAGQKFGTNSTQATVAVLAQAIAKSICQTATKSCAGRNKQYQNNEECMAYLTGKVRFGAAYELGRDTLLCRMVHQNMVPLRPEVHCSHIGKTGGGYCVDDKDYRQTVLDDHFTRAPWVPFGYGAKGGI